ncbi:MAG TPA: PAS domain S-box protein, partial [Coleofasciculaceae cyanobacterium]
MEDTEKSRTELLEEIQNLRDRLAISEETLQAIQQGDVDALVVSTQQGERIFTLQSADQSYRLLVESMQQGAAILSPAGLIVYCNRSFANLLKQPLEQLMGSQFEQLISPLDLPRVQALVQEAERGERNSIELFLTTQEAEFPVYLSINHLNLGDSSIHCVVVTDLTEQKRHEETLASERLARLILEQAGEAILVCDHTGKIIRVSQVANQLWGENLLQQSFDTLCPLYWASSSRAALLRPTGSIARTTSEPDRPKAAFSIDSILQGESYRGLEVELQRPDGQVFSLVLNARPLTDQDNYFRGAVVILTDITPRRQAEIALQESQLELQQQLAEIEAIYQSAPIGLNVIDTNLRFVRINQRLAEINGLSVEAHIGHTVREVLPELADEGEQLLRSILETGEPLLNVEVSGETPAQPGVQRTWLESFLPLKDGDRIIGISTVCQEITDRKRVEEELRRAKAELEIRVAERTEELQQANNRLHQELLQRTQAERELQENVSSLQAFYGVIAARHQSFEQRIQDLLTTGCRLFGLEFGILARVQNGQYQVMVARSPDDVLKPGDTFDVQQTLCCEILDTDEPLTIQHAAVSQWLHHPAYATFQMECYIGTRVLVKGQLYSTLSFSSKTPAVNEFKPSYKELLKLMAQWIGSEIERQQANDRLQQELVQRVQIEQQLRQSETRYRAIVEDQTELILRFAPDSTMLFVNDAFCRYFGVEYDDIVGQSYKPIVYKADREKVVQLVQSINAENPTLVIENRVIDAQGAVRWTQWVNRMLCDAQGNAIEFQSVGRDITELKQAEQALRESQERLQLALEASGDGIWDWQIPTNEVYFSPQYFYMLGYDADELPMLPSTWYQLVHPDDLVWVQKILSAHLKDNSVRYAFDYRLRTKSGEWKWIADYAKVVAWDEAGNPIRMIGTHRDVNDRKLMEAALRQSEEQRRLALDLTRLGFWDLHLPTDNLTWNENHFALLGLPIGGTPRYEDWRDRIYPDDVERVEQLFLGSINTHTDYEAEYRVVHPDGSVHWLLSRGRAIYDDQNQPLRSLGVVLDISDRKRMEASLQESDRRWRSLLDNVQLVVVELNTKATVEYANPFFLKLTGYSSEEVMGQSWFNRFLPPGQKSATEIVFQEAITQNFHTHYQNPILTQSGEERMIAWNNTVLRDAAGEAIGIISIGEDITERYRVERMKSEFISVVSHELRTPLTSMQAALSLLSEKIIDPASVAGEATI